MNNYILFCDDLFWNQNLTWSNETPQLTKCLRQIGFTLFPNLILWILLPIELSIIFKSKSNSIKYNWFNFIRFCACLWLVFFNLIEITFLIYNSISKSVFILSNFLACLVKLLTIILLCYLFRLHRLRGIITSGCVWLYLFVNTICLFFIQLDIYVSYSEKYNQIEFYTCQVNFFLNLFLLILCIFTDDPVDAGLKPRKIYHNKYDLKDVKLNKFKKDVLPSVYASFLSRLFYSWFTPFISYAWSFQVTLQDLWPLKQSFFVDNLVSKFCFNFNLNKNLETNKNRVTCFTIIQAFYKTYGFYYLGIDFTRFLTELLTILYPILLSQIINSVQSESNFKWQIFLFSFLLFSISLIKAVLVNFYLNRHHLLVTKLKTNLMSLIYDKTLKLSLSMGKKFTTGKMMNLLTVYINTFVEVFQYLNIIWLAPFKVMIVIYLLYDKLGDSTIYGLIVITVLTTLSAFWIRKNKKNQVCQMKKKDERIKIINEILNGIKIIKVYAWENAFIDKINRIRNSEIMFIKNYYINLIFINFLSSVTPTLVLLVVFISYFNGKANILTAEKAFVSLYLINLLQTPFKKIPLLFSTLLNSSIALKQLVEFLNADELQNYITRRSDENYSIKFEKEMHFDWLNVDEKAEPNSFKLKINNLKIKKKSFVAVIGRISNGKSSFLNCLLGEMNLSKSNKNDVKFNIAKDEKISYVTQQAWIQNASLRENILFKEEFNIQKYAKILKCCALEPDLKLFKSGDLIEIGEKGINLSGGQKQRINLARACYSDSSLVLMDDPLSAVDIHVGKHIFDHVLSSKTGLLKNCTRVLVTNQLDYLPFVDQILIFHKGQIVSNCTYEEFIKSDAITKYEIKFNKIKLDPRKEETVKNQFDSQVNNHKSSQNSNLINYLNKLENKLCDEENIKKGEVEYRNYNIYFTFFGYFLFLILILMFLMSNLVNLYSNVYLASWTDKNLIKNMSSHELNDFNLHHFKIFISICCLRSLFETLSTIIIVYGGISSAIKIHQLLIQKVIKSKMLFFDTTPIGRILNRFSQEMDVLDSNLINKIDTWFQLFFKCIFSYLVIMYQSIFFLFFFLSLIFIYYILQSIYIKVSRQLKRLHSVTRSPIYSFFSETLIGSQTIRAYSKQYIFTRTFNSKIQQHNSCFVMLVNTMRWLKIRIELLSNFIILVTSCFVAQNKDNLKQGDVGLLLSYAIGTTEILGQLVRCTGDIENDVVSIERINEYCENEEEIYLPDKCEKLPFDWPNNGIIEFNNYSARYRKENDLVLKNLNFKINSKEKVGIIGRTGAGKSTTTLAIFRFIEPSTGQIIIDGLDISRISLYDLRSRISIIPQDPIIFSDTIRFNLDPFNNYSDNQLWQALEHAHLNEYVNSFKEGLSFEVSEGGENLSLGQKQLICLGRALLRNSKILILDEATASVDYCTDELVQKTIRKEFENCTTITIAHRINTILDSDKILVLENGCLKQFDKIQNLSQNSFHF